MWELIDYGPDYTATSGGKITKPIFSFPGGRRFQFTYPSGKDVVLSFWNAMKTNDYALASEWLSLDFEGFWPQSGEMILGRENFIAINTYYPANGDWLFDIHSVVCEGDTVVTDVSITDGVQQARAIKFHTIENGLITKQKEFWPDDMPPQGWRSQWVKIVSNQPRK